MNEMTKSKKSLKKAFDGFGKIGEDMGKSVAKTLKDKDNNEEVSDAIRLAEEFVQLSKDEKEDFWNAVEFIESQKETAH